MLLYNQQILRGSNVRDFRDKHESGSLKTLQAQAACTKVICSTRKKPFLSIYSAIDLLPSTCIRENTLNKFTIFKIITINSKILVNLNNLKQITIRKIVIDKQHEAIL